MKSALLAVVLVLAPGCVTLSSFPRVYGGARAYAEAFDLVTPDDPRRCGTGDILLRFLAPLDLLPSLTLDTLLVPITLPIELARSAAKR